MSARENRFSARQSLLEGANKFLHAISIFIDHMSAIRFRKSAGKATQHCNATLCSNSHTLPEGVKDLNKSCDALITALNYIFQYMQGRIE